MYFFISLQGGTRCPCKRRGSRWFMVRNLWHAQHQCEGGACFRKFAYVIKLRPMLRDSWEWFVSPTEYFFFHPIFLGRHFFFFHPSLNLFTYYVYVLYLYIYILSRVVPLNAFSGDDFFFYVRGLIGPSIKPGTFLATT